MLAALLNNQTAGLAEATVGATAARRRDLGRLMISINTAFNRDFDLVDIDGLPVTGQAGSVAVTLSKAGGAHALITPAITERSNGGYTMALTTAHNDTVGSHTKWVTATGAVGFFLYDQVDDRIVASVTGAVGSVTGNVTGNVQGTVSAVTGNVQGNVNGNVNGSVGSVTDNTTVLAAIAIVLAAISTPTAIAEAIMTALVEGTITVREALRIANAVNAGKVSGMGTTVVRVRDTGDTKDRIVATVDLLGNRMVVTRDMS